MDDKWSKVPGLSENVRDDLRRMEAVFGAVELQEEGLGMDDETGFNVMEDYTLPDLTGVKEERDVLPAASQVLLRIRKASEDRLMSRDDQTRLIKRSVALECILPEGMPVPSEDGLVTKYVNKVVFLRFPFWVDEEIYQGKRYTGDRQAFLVPLKQLLVALGYDPKSPPTLGDAFYAEVAQREFRADVVVRPIRIQDEAGAWVDSGEFQNEFRSLHAV